MEVRQPFSVVAQMVRLGEKYKIEYLREDGISRLCAEFHPTLEEWSASREWMLIEEPASPADRKAFFIDCANLALEANILRILPAIFLQIPWNRELDMKEILQGVPRADGSVAVLTEENKLACLTGVEKLRKAQLHHTFGFLLPDFLPSPQCTTEGLCRAFKQDRQFRYWGPPGQLKPVDAWDDGWDKELCGPCLKVAKDIHTEGCQHVWNHLPSYFGLPPWEELLTSLEPSQAQNPLIDQP